MRKINLARLQDLILARLVVRSKIVPTAEQVSKTLHAIGARQFSKPEWVELFSQALDALRASGLVDETRLEITTAGRRRLQTALALDKPVVAANWSELKRKYLPRLLRPDLPAAGEKPARLSLAILAERLGVAVEPKTSPAQIIDRWLGLQLGLKPGARVTLDAIRTRLLARELGLPERRSVPQAVGLAVATLSGATSSKDSAVNDALTLRWLLEEPSPEKPHPPANVSLERIAAKALQAAAGPDARRFGASKAFIGSVWRALANDPEIARLGEATFKRQLVEAHRRGLLVLSRADLVAAMDPGEVAASETTHQNATYHFISRGASA